MTMISEQPPAESACSFAKTLHCKQHAQQHQAHLPAAHLDVPKHTNLLRRTPFRPTCKHLTAHAYKSASPVPRVDVQIDRRTHKSTLYREETMHTEVIISAKRGKWQRSSKALCKNKRYHRHSTGGAGLIVTGFDLALNPFTASGRCQQDNIWL